MPTGSDVRPVAPARVESVDLLRGLVIVLMALDHTRNFFSNAGFYPLNLDRTNVPLFLTRWITHFCAPTFVFLAGTGAFLSSRRGKSTPELAVFLFSRGLWLVILELTVIRWLGWKFSFDMHHLTGGVIWVIGWSMIALSCLVFLPTPALTAIGLALIAAHNAFDGVTMADSGVWRNVWQVLHLGKSFELAPGITFAASYPLIPWIGVMAVGFGFGLLLKRENSERRAWIFRLGLAATILFVLVRASNLYGDPHPWSVQKSGVFTAFSFVSCEKYPPSLCYLLMTLGPALMLLAFFDQGTPRVLAPLLTFGRVPLFFYVLHLPLIHALAVAAARAGHGRFGLLVVYLLWAAVIAILYPACRWFAALKQRRRDWWLSYL